MSKREKPKSGGTKKHGDFSKFIRKKESTNRPGKKLRKSGPDKSKGSHNTAKLIGDRFREMGEEPFDKKSRRKAPLDQAKRRPSKKTNENAADSGLIRLNKFIAHSGVCSRREADTLIETGAVKVNGEVISELGAKIKPTDKVQVGGETLVSEKHRYVLLNKPKGYITTTDDPEKRNTVMMLVEKACKERIYPVGRLDRNTTGLLLFTNDGDLAKKLTHPGNNMKKIYHVHLDQPVSHAHMEEIAEGVQLEDGIIKPDAVDYVGDGQDRKQVGIELHSGKNRIVRRIFETLGYKVIKLDRVFFAGLTKKDLPRGRYRHLTEKELNVIRMM